MGLLTASDHTGTLLLDYVLGRWHRRLDGQRRGSGKRKQMSIAQVPEALAKRLGEEGTEGLVAVLDSTRQDWTDSVLTAAVDRFEYRLTTEISALRFDVSREISGLRQDVTREIAAVRQDVTREIAAVRQDVTRELAGVRVELLKWSFLFWVGQVAAMAGLLAFMIRR